MRRLPLLNHTLLLTTVLSFPLAIGCGGSKDNEVIAPTTSDDEIRAATDEKLERLKNVDPSTL